MTDDTLETITTTALPPDLEAAKWDLEGPQMTALIERWARATVDVEETTAHLPMAVLLGEAVDLAGIVEAYFQPSERNGEQVPGLSSIAKTGAVSERTPEELRELAMAVGAVRSRIRKLVEASNRAEVEEAEDVLEELRATLSFVIDEEGDAQAEEQLARLGDDHKNADSHDEMALALQAYAELADEHQDKLALIGTFSAELPSRARGLAQALRQRSADQLSGQNATAVQSAMRMRNRLIGALVDRMRTARKAIRFVFRKHPEIVRASTSSYERNRRRNHRRRTTTQEGSGAPAASEETADVGATPLGSDDTEEVSIAGGAPRS